MAAQVGVGLVGSGFIAEMHAQAFALSTIASVRAVASRSADRAAAFARQHDIPAWHTDFRELAERSDVDLVCIGAPNDLHRDIAVAAAEAGQARGLREATGPDAGRGRRDDRGLPRARGEAHVRRGDLLRAQVRAGQGARRRGRARRCLPGAAGRAALRPALGLVLGSASGRAAACSWTWAATASSSPAGCTGSRRRESVTAELGTFVHHERTAAEDHAIVTVRFDGQPARPDRDQLGQAGRDGRPGRDRSGRRASPTPTCCAARP